ncbi:MAG: lipid A biosynthesis acyltransferase [Bacteroidota bacterium]
MKKFLFNIYAIPFYVLGMLPYPILYMFSNLLYYLAFYVIGYRKKVVYGNIRNAFPTYTEQQVETIAKKFYKHLFDVFLETFKLLTCSAKELYKKGVYPNFEVIQPFIDKKQSFIILTGHMGNWEWLPSIWHLEKTVQICGIYHKLSSPFFEWLTFKMRTRMGVHLFTMENTLREMVAQRNEFTATGFIADQTPSAQNAHWLTFLNQDTPVFIGAEKIAKKFKYPVVYCHVTKPRRGYYECRLEVLCDDASTTDDFYVTNIFHKKLEEDIIHQPEIWLWSHRRWKHKRPAKD